MKILCFHLGDGIFIIFPCDILNDDADCWKKGSHIANVLAIMQGEEIYFILIWRSRLLRDLFEFISLDAHTHVLP